MSQSKSKDYKLIMLKASIKWILKCFIAGIIAIAILSFFSILYYNNGVRKTSKTGASDYAWENRFHSIGYEGFAWGMYDKNGYNNVYKSDKDTVDILLMGSSHMNAYNVSSKHSIAYLLNDMMNTSGLDYNLYNIGMEGHDFYVCSDNLDDALEAYSPQKYVLMETRTVRLSEEDMMTILDGTRERTPAFDSGMIYYLQKIPYFRLLHRQIRNMCNLNDNSLLSEYNNKDGKTDYVAVAADYETLLNRYMEKLGKTVDDKGVKLIIFYMPDISFNDDGTISANGSSEDISEFVSACESQGIECIDMSDTFVDNYNKNYKLPFGFSNTEIGKGHLNREGHKLIAEKLYEKILEMENL